MHKYVQFIIVLIFVACIAACGSSDVTTAPETQIYETGITVTTLTGVAKTAGSSDHGTIDDPPATFNHPTDITTADGSTFFIADYANSAIRKVTSTGEVSTLSFTTDGTAPTSFYRPFSLTINADGSQLYVADNSYNTIRFIDISTNIVTTVGSTTGLAGSVNSTIPADVLFNSPTGIATDGTNLYVADSGNHTIRKINISTKEVSTLAGASGAVGTTNSTDGTGATARFNGPQRITTDGTNLYVTDFNNRTIRKIVISSGNTTTLAGVPGPVGASGGIADSTDGTGATARFNQPNGITTDGTNLYVTDSYMNTIRKIVISSGETTTVSGVAETAGFVDTADGTPSFDTPIGITTINGANLFVTDTNNHTIRKIAQSVD